MDVPTRNEDLPSYDECTGSNNSHSNDLVPQETLCISDRFIRSNDPLGPPLYEFSHHLNSLKETDRKVVMEKLQLQVRTTEGEPTIKSRNRVLFHLKHPKKGEMCMFPYQAESQSRQTLANMGIERSDTVFKTGRRFRFVPAKWGADRRLRKEGKQVLFEAAETTGHRGNGVVWEWRNGDGELLARELFRDGELSLGVTAAMTARERDALVAAWYLRIWWIRGEETYERPRFRAQVNRVLHSKNGPLAEYQL